MNKIISLVGPRTTGKTTIGKELGKILKWKFIDFDLLMIKKLKKERGIIGYTKKNGWEKYYKKINSSLKQLFKDKKNQRVILDIGGGTISSEFPASKLNAKLIKKYSKIFLIVPEKEDKANIKILIKRENKRCKEWKDYLLNKYKEKELNKKVKKDYVERISELKKHADYQIFTKRKSPKEVAKKIIKIIQSSSKQKTK